MGVEIAEGIVVVTADASDVSRDVGRAIQRDQGPFESAGDASARSFGSVFKGSFFGNFLGNIATDIVGQIGYAIGSGVRTAVDFGLGTIDIASHLGESINAVQVSYGDVADEILDLGKTSAKTFGLSKRDLNAYATQFSSFTRTIAGSGGDVADTFKTILGRATDFSSVMDIEVSDALALFQSGLSGESEPLRRYGIDLSAAAVEAYALRSGISDGTTELTEAQKQQARYGAILEQTSAVQGDFANTSDSLANANRSNAATWDDLQAKIGEGFLPLATSVAGILSDTVFPAIDELVTEYGPGIGQAFEDIGPAVKEFAEDILPKIPGLITNVAEAAPEFIGFLSDTTGFLIDLGDAFDESKMPEWPGLVAILGDLFAPVHESARTADEQIGIFFTNAGERLTLGAEQWGTFGSGVGTFFGDFGGRLTQGGEQIGGFFGVVGEKLATGGAQIGGFFGLVGGAVSTGVAEFTRFADEVGVNAGRAIDFVAGLPGRAAGALGDLGRTLFYKGQALIQGFIDGITGMLGNVGDAVGGVLDWARGFFPSSPAKRGPFSGSGWIAIGKSGGAVMEQWTSGFARPDLTGRLGGVADVFGEIAPRPTLGGGSRGAGGTAGEGASGYGGGEATIHIEVNEATDPLGSVGRISTELRRWKAAV